MGLAMGAFLAPFDSMNGLKVMCHIQTRIRKHRNIWGFILCRRYFF